MDLNHLTPRIDQALVVLRSVVTALDDADWGSPTACAEWNVRDVHNHTVGGMNIFAAELAGASIAADHESDWLGDDPLGAFEAAAVADSAAWRGPFPADRTVTISLGRLPLGLAAVIHLTELVTHGVDLACATGRVDLLDERLCAGLLDAMHGMGGVDDYRVPGVFGPAVAVGANSAPHVRLAAYLGRDLVSTLTPAAFS